MGAGYEIYRNILLESSITEYNKLGEHFIVTDDWDQFYNITDQDLMGNGTHATMAAYMTPYDLHCGWYISEDLHCRWYRSKEKVPGIFPFGGYLTNKKWHLNEVT